MYPLLERLSPGTRKLEVFGRAHNTQAGWLTLGSRLDGVRLTEPGLRAAFLAAYPPDVKEDTKPSKGLQISL